AKTQVPEDQSAFVLQPAFASGILLGQLEWARALDKERALDRLGPPGWDGGREIQLANQLDEQERCEPSPCTVAATGRFAPQDLQAFEFNSKRILQQLRASGKATFNLTPPNHFDFSFGPGSRNVDFIVDVDLKPFRPLLQGSEPEAHFNLVSVENGVEDAFLTLYLHKNGGVRVWGPDLPYMW